MENENIQLQELADLFGIEDIEMEELLIDAGIDLEDIWF